MNAIANVSRREFVKGICSTGALVLSASLVPEILRAQTSSPGASTKDAVLRPNVFVAIQSDDTVSIVAARSEMGTGISTALPLVLADELDADWTKVKIQQADGDKHYGDQDTDGSHSVRSFFDVMRGCGAAARHMLIQAAAVQWKVPAAACETELGMVIHRASGRKASYGQLAASASKLPVPDQAKLRFKPKGAWRYIGKDTPRYNLAALCTGRPVFGIDQRVEGMVYASVERPPVFGGKVKSYDDRDALRVRGVHQSVAIPPFNPPCAMQALGGVAVIADNTWAALQGRHKLKVVWDNGSNADLRLDEIPQRVEGNIAQTLQGHPQCRRRRGGVCEARQDSRGRLLRAAACTRVDGTPGCGRGLPRRQGHRMGAHPGSADRAERHSQ
jgi:isoquinoline 1-oxidoreductase beta subunit